MRQSFRRAGLLAMAFLVTLAGMVFVTGTASAAKTRQLLDVRESFTQACEIDACAKDVQPIPIGERVDTYCAHPEGQFNLTYTGPTFGRGGYIPVANFAGDVLNTQLCSSVSAGEFARADTATSLFSCSGGGCVNFGGTIQDGEQLRAFCQLPPEQPNSMLVYVPSNTFAGFVRISDLDPEITPSVPSCNQGF
jgi:hypothetical protein